jgi:hypothetical protein
MNQRMIVTATLWRQVVAHFDSLLPGSKSGWAPDAPPGIWQNLVTESGYHGDVQVYLDSPRKRCFRRYAAARAGKPVDAWIEKIN